MSRTADVAHNPVVMLRISNDGQWLMMSEMVEGDTGRWLMDLTNVDGGWIAIPAAQPNPTSDQNYLEIRFTVTKP